RAITALRVPSPRTLALHAALPICRHALVPSIVAEPQATRVAAAHRAETPSGSCASPPSTHAARCPRNSWRTGHRAACVDGGDARSEEHTSELQSRVDIVCRLLLET